MAASGGWCGSTLSGKLEPEHQRQELVLDTVVQVTHEAPPLLSASERSSRRSGTRRKPPFQVACEHRPGSQHAALADFSLTVAGADNRGRLKTRRAGRPFVESPADVAFSHLRSR